MRGALLLSILEHLADSAIELSDFFEAVVFSGYGASSAKIAYESKKIGRSRRSRARERAKERRVYNLLYRLRKDGLIEDDVHNRRQSIQISSKGLEFLKKLRTRKLRALPDISLYRKEDDRIIKIVLFDIPERERAKRNWLRTALGRLGFRMLQRSVWIGKAKLPKEFLDVLSQLKISEYVEIIGITKTGTLKPLI